MICETIEHAAVSRVSSYDFVILPLIEIKTGLVSAQKIDIEFYAFHFDHDRRQRRGALENASAQFQSFRPADWRVVALDDRRRTEQIDNCARDQIFSQIHRQGERLQ